MSRANTNQEVVHDLRSVGFYIDSGTATTLTSAVAKGVAILPVTSETGFVVDDVVRIGANGSGADIGVVKAVTTLTITLDHPLVNAQATAAAVTKLTFTDMGATNADGVRIEFTGDETPLPSGTQKATYLFLAGANETAINWALLNASPENLAQALGEDETSVSFVHTLPDAVTLDPNAFASLGFRAWLFEGIREDAKAVKAYVFAGKVAAPNTSLQFTTGQAMEIAMALRSVNAIRWTFE